MLYIGLHWPLACLNLSLGITLWHLLLVTMIVAMTSVTGQQYPVLLDIWVTAGSHFFTAREALTTKLLKLSFGPVLGHCCIINNLNYETNNTEVLRPSFMGQESKGPQEAPETEMSAGCLLSGAWIRERLAPNFLRLSEFIPLHFYDWVPHFLARFLWGQLSSPRGHSQILAKGSPSQKVLSCFESLCFWRAQSL